MIHYVVQKILDKTENKFCKVTSLFFKKKEKKSLFESVKKLQLNLTFKKL